MIKYSLNIDIEPLSEQINFDDKIALLGSCFTEHISKRLGDFHFDVLTNPNGIVFNPVSLAEPIKRLMDPGKYSKDDLVFYNNKWVSLFHHGKYSNEVLEDCLENINKQQSEFETFISSAGWLIMTFGTAWIYQYSDNGIIVANCHKIPQDQFKKRLLKVNEIVDCWQASIDEIKKINPNINFIFTVSPVKHLRDGVHENNLSKATLLLAIEQLLGDNIHYFPAYELVIDDLRDYRFFDSDAAHPNGMAIDYIFDKFRQSVLSGESNEMINALDKFYKLKNHRQINVSDANSISLNTRLEAMRKDLIAMNFRLTVLL